MTLTSLGILNSGHGVVEKAIALNRLGRIKYQGIYWSAKLANTDCQPINLGETIRLVGREGITLLVVPEHYSC